MFFAIKSPFKIKILIFWPSPQKPAWNGNYIFLSSMKWTVRQQKWQFIRILHAKYASISRLSIYCLQMRNVCAFYGTKHKIAAVQRAINQYTTLILHKSFDCVAINENNLRIVFDEQFELIKNQLNVDSR